MSQQNGFTLIETAIVLIIVGLLLGGLLRGQELITIARVRHLIAQHDGIKAAYLGFQDRYRALPGDYGGAAANIPQCNAVVPCVNGDNNGQISTTTATPPAPNEEYISAWEHLAKAGFVTGSYSYAATPAPTNTPVNPYGTLMQLIYDNAYQNDASVTGPIRHNLKTGNEIPSNVLAEVDRKTDDGDPTKGAFRFSAFSASGNAPAGSGFCFSATAPNRWLRAAQIINCGGARLF
ncbi:MAG: prepilin-type N-terminal cleavage/methylation domain-containing protein [Betaproteobacteria bacterium]|nr:MAG: prepilin-type N-terminal cleavage/methylation domain-containing protein [Betaproteobacteria bacterium]